MPAVKSKWKLFVVASLVAQIFLGILLHAVFTTSAVRKPSITQKRPGFRCPSLSINQTLPNNDRILEEYRPKSRFFYLNSGSHQKSEELESSQWAPLAITACANGMPGVWAPCIQAMNSERISFAEELLFPDFMIKYPGFPESKRPGRSSEEQFRALLAELRSRGDLEARNAAVYESHVLYRGIRGQNFVIHNSTYLNSFPVDNGCKAAMLKLRSSPISDGIAVPYDGQTPMYVQSAMIAVSAQEGPSARIEHVLEQSAHLFNPQTKVFIDQQQHPTELSMRDYFGSDDAESLMRLPTNGVWASRMIMSCQTSALHPWFALRFVERLGVTRNIPVAQRKKILFVSDAGNADSELVRAMSDLLAERSRGEELVRTEQIHDQYPTFPELVEWVNQNVIAVIGFQSEAFHNHRFCSQNTLVLEIIPRTKIARGSWEQASLLSQYYYMFLQTSSDDGEAILLNQDDIQAIGDVLRSYLEKNERRKGEEEMANHAPIALFYDWKADPRGFKVPSAKSAV